MQLRRREQGDTLIEVLFAVAVFAMVAVGCLAIMNQGVATAQRSLEVTLVRQQIDAQAEALRYIHKIYVASYHEGTPTPPGPAQEWKKMINTSPTGNGVLVASSFGALEPSGRCLAAPPVKSFILNTHTATIWTTDPPMYPPAGVSLPPFAQVSYDAASNIDHSYGIWIESVPSTTPEQTGFVDFHIRACWDSAGADIPVTLGTIVRLYDPR